jgi:2-methylcitrate dehydratase PrpD
MATGASYGYGLLDATCLTPSTLYQEIKVISAFASNPHHPCCTAALTAIRAAVHLREKGEMRVQ